MVLADITVLNHMIKHGYFIIYSQYYSDVFFSLRKKMIILVSSRMRLRQTTIDTVQAVKCL